MRIGISASFFHADPQRPIFKGKTLLYLEQSLAHWILSEGVLAYMIPSVHAQSGTQVRDLAADLDGLVLQGGSDVSPKSYGETALKPEWAGDFVRDQYEMDLVRTFAGLGKPVLGVCRGAQLINVAYGGTLYQDIPTQIPGAGNHRNWDVYENHFHTVSLEQDSELSKLFPKTKSAKVNSIHHQAVKDLGKGLIAESRSEGDGIVEAIRLKAAHYVFAVQWHPEFHDPQDTSLLNSKVILQDFLKECAAHA